MMSARKLLRIAKTPIPLIALTLATVLIISSITTMLSLPSSNAAISSRLSFIFDKISSQRPFQSAYAQEPVPAETKLYPCEESDDTCWDNCPDLYYTEGGKFEGCQHGFGTHMMSTSCPEGYLYERNDFMCYPEEPDCPPGPDGEARFRNAYDRCAPVDCPSKQTQRGHVIEYEPGINGNCVPTPKCEEGQFYSKYYAGCIKEEGCDPDELGKCTQPPREDVCKRGPFRGTVPDECGFDLGDLVDAAKSCLREGTLCNEALKGLKDNALGNEYDRGFMVSDGKGGYCWVRPNPFIYPESGRYECPNTGQ